MGTAKDLIDTFPQGKVEQLLLAIYSPGLKIDAKARDKVVKVAGDFNTSDAFTMEYSRTLGLGTLLHPV